MKKCFILCIVLILVVCFSTVAFGLSNSTYASLSQSSSTADTLISYASNYDTFFDAEYVCYQSGQYDYYIVWGDLEFANNTVSGENVHYVRYYREGTTGSYNYMFTYNTDDKFAVSLNDSIVTNIVGAGGNSVTYKQLYFYEYGLLLLVIAVGGIFASLILRRI